jgi:hypothetical protein
VWISRRKQRHVQFVAIWKSDWRERGRFGVWRPLQLWSCESRVTHLESRTFLVIVMKVQTATRVLATTALIWLFDWTSRHVISNLLGFVRFLHAFNSSLWRVVESQPPCCWRMISAGLAQFWSSQGPLLNRSSNLLLLRLSWMRSLPFSWVLLVLMLRKVLNEVWLNSLLGPPLTCRKVIVREVPPFHLWIVCIYMPHKPFRLNPKTYEIRFSMDCHYL